MIRKAAAVGPAVVFSTAMVGLVVGPALPIWSQLVVGYGGLVIAGALVLRCVEPLAVRLLFDARRLTDVEATGMAPVLANLSARGLGPPVIDFYAARRAWQPLAVARGRRSVVVSAEIIEGSVTGELPVGEATALLARAGLTVRDGYSRLDPLIAFWTLPWRLMARLARPRKGLLGLAWAMRPIVGGIAIVQSIDTQPAPLGVMSAAGIVTLLTLTYLAPRWARSWDRYVLEAADVAVAEDGLGDDLAKFLRRLPPSTAIAGRIQKLTATTADASSRPQLRLVAGSAQ